MQAALPAMVALLFGPAPSHEILQEPAPELAAEPEHFVTAGEPLAVVTGLRDSSCHCYSS